LADLNLARAAEDRFARLGDYDEVVFEGRTYRSGEMFERSRRLAGGLDALGVEPGDRVVVFAANRPEVQIAYYAIWRAGAVVTPAIFLLPPPELRHIVEGAEARLVITSAEFADTAREAVGATRVVTIDDFPDLEEAGPLPIVPRDDADLAALMYTGGTTGRAKGVMLTHANLWHVGRSADEAGFEPGIVRGLMALPLSHAFGLLITVIDLHDRVPGLTVLMRWFEPTGWLELAQEHRIQIAAAVPTMLRRLLDEPLEQYDLSGLRYLASGASPLAPETVRELRRRLPDVEIREGYGLTETSGLVSTNRPRRIRMGSVGEPVPGVEVRIVDDVGNELPVGEVGEICCRSSFVMAGYWRDAEATAGAVRGGWLSTGDLGSLDEDGYLYVVDRKKDLIIRGGLNVFPRDVEEALCEHDAVETAAVVGRPDAAHGEEVVAFVTLRDGRSADPAELVAWARERLGGYKYPREMHVLPALPLTPVGKVDRKALRAKLLEAVQA
jgi:long-chain acyl-CoA synthetase